MTSLAPPQIRERVEVWRRLAGHSAGFAPLRGARGRRLPSPVVASTLAIAIALSWSSVTQSVAPDENPTLPVSAIESVGFTVTDMERALAFYTGVLPFKKIADTEVSGRPYELLSGVFGARSRVVRLQLGDEYVELTEFLAPKGRSFPADLRANDRAFQHMAIVVRDLERGYRHLRQHAVPHASTGPQLLPPWNPSAGGIGAFYFRDPDGHFLEIISFPPGKGLPVWHQRRDGGLFLGIDHTAIVVENTDQSLRLYRDALGMRVVGESENYDVEQEHLNNVFGARLRITALRADHGPGIEFLEYLAPRDGRPAPHDLRANDVLHWQTTLAVRSVDPLLRLARQHRINLVSPGPIADVPAALTFQQGALARDRDGHGLRFIAR
jgi:catechol 2,3-dioxygenase-like lactoylglutathione lyase family enzyme